MMRSDPQPGKPPAESAAETVQVVLPNDTNPLGNVLGGTVVHWIDLIGAVVAHRHSNRPVVTASMERMDFHAPIRLGWIVTLAARVTFAGRTSMEVAVEVHAEDPLSGTRQHTSSAVLTYVALEASGRPAPVPPVAPQTDAERALHQVGAERYRARKQRAAAGARTGS